MEMPVIYLSLYLESKEGKVRDLCGEVSRSLRETGALFVKDPRCTAKDNDRFLNMMERYFDSPSEFKRLQERPQLHYQVGVTPEGVEVPRSFADEEMQHKLKQMPKPLQPSTPKGPDRIYLA